MAAGPSPQPTPVPLQVKQHKGRFDKLERACVNDMSVFIAKNKRRNEFESITLASLPDKCLQLQPEVSGIFEAKSRDSTCYLYVLPHFVHISESQKFYDHLLAINEHRHQDKPVCIIMPHRYYLTKQMMSNLQSCNYQVTPMCTCALVKDIPFDEHCLFQTLWKGVSPPHIGNKCEVYHYNDTTLNRIHSRTPHRNFYRNVVRHLYLGTNADKVRASGFHVEPVVLLATTKSQCLSNLPPGLEGVICDTSSRTGAQLPPDSQAIQPTLYGSHMASHDSAILTTHEQHAANRKRKRRIADIDSSNLAKQIALPTDSRERQKIKEKADKEAGIEKVKKKKTKFIEDHHDDCGNDVSSIVPDLDNYL